MHRSLHPALGLALACCHITLTATVGCVGGAGSTDGSNADLIGGDGLQFRDVGVADLRVDVLAPDVLPAIDLLPPPDLPPPDLPPPDLPPPDVDDACVPSCVDRDCGDDGCGGSCGTCGANQSCVANRCEDDPLEIAINGTPELVWEYKSYNYCAFPDGPVRLYRDADGRASAIIPHARNYRFSSTTTDGELVVQSFVTPTLVFDSPQNSIESIYDSRIWLSGLWTDDGTTIHAVGHHEWYHPTLYTLQQPELCVPLPTAALGWVNAVHHLTSTNGGATFETTVPVVLPVSNQNDRLVLAPETWTYQGVAKPVYPNGEVRYGFFRPSNIAKEGSYFYVAVAVEELVRNTPGGNDHVIPYRRGFSLIRTTDIASGWASGKWQRYSGAGWLPVSGVVANGATHIFTHDASQPAPRTVLQFADSALAGDLFYMTLNLTRCTVNDRWLLLGHTGVTKFVAYTTTENLAQPKWTAVRHVAGSDLLMLGSEVHPWPADEGGTQVSSWASAYPSIVDHQSAGRVYQFTGAAPRLYYAKSNGGVDRDLYRVQLKISVAP